MRRYTTYTLMARRWTKALLVLFAFGMTRLPWLVYSCLHADDALTSPRTFTALSITIVALLILITPALGLFYVMSRRQLYR